MPKQKTKKSVASKFKITGTGKVLHSRSGRRHLLTNKTSKRKRQLRSTSQVETNQAKTITRMIKGL